MASLGSWKPLLSFSLSLAARALELGSIARLKIMSIYCWSVDVFFWRKSPSRKVNSMGTLFPIGKEKIGLRGSHSFGRFLIEKKSAKLLQQISSPHSTCEEVVTGTVPIFQVYPLQLTQS